MYHHQLAAAVTMVSKFPEQAFVLDHIAKPKISEAPTKKWIDEINALAQHPTVYCKVSGMVTEAINFEWKAVDLYQVPRYNCKCFWSR